MVPTSTHTTIIIAQCSYMEMMDSGVESGVCLRLANTWFTEIIFWSVHVWSFCTHVSSQKQPITNHNILLLRQNFMICPSTGVYESRILSSIYYYEL